jgi:hypothetical protein
MKPALKAPLRSLVLLLLPSLGRYEATFYYCYQVSDSYEAVLLLRPKLCHYDAQNRNRRQEFYDGFDCQTTFYFDRDKTATRPQQSRVLQPQRYRLRKPVTR